MTFEDAVLNNYYQQFMAESDGLPQGEASFNAITTDNQTTEEMRAQVAAAIRPTVDQSIGSLRSNVTSQRASVDADAASRGMGRSTFVSDIKSRISQSEQDSLASIESNYGANLAQQVAQAWENQKNRNATVGAQNESNRLNVSQFNAQRKVQREQTAYERAVRATALWKSQQSSGSTGGQQPADADGFWQITNETGPLVRQGNQVVDDAYSVLKRTWVPAN